MKAPKYMKQHTANSTKKGLSLFFERMGRKINDIFTPEEVEVTFNGDGKHTTYTYTKVQHKQVA